MEVEGLWNEKEKRDLNFFVVTSSSVYFFELRLFEAQHHHHHHGNSIVMAEVSAVSVVYTVD
jgi:hypothetical protein